jgi:cellulose biosynthesis protein BcsQ
MMRSGVTREADGRRRSKQEEDGRRSFPDKRSRMTVVNMPRSTNADPLGRIVTFYSYKGGTGRSMTLANIGWILAFHGYRVLLIDWDLEAPGLHRYFHPFLRDKHLQSTPGLFDLVESLAARAATSTEALSENDVDIFGYLTQLECPRDSWVRLPWGLAKEETRPKVEGATSAHRAPAYVGIDLMPAGRQAPTYAGRLNNFNWISFYERLDGRRLPGLARKQMRETYDYVLIDSRTGVSDTSGICTVEMPHTLVVCFTLNDQSILGASGITESILAQRAHLESVDDASGRNAAPFRIFPVPTRVEVTSERDKRDAALDLAQRTFARYLGTASASEQSK